MAYRSSVASLYRLQRFVWIPLQTQAFISLVCALFMLALGASGFAGFPAFKSYAEIKADPDRMIVFSAALLVGNYLFLLRQSRSSYFSLRAAIVPTLSCLLILSIVSYVITLTIVPYTVATVADQQLRALLVAQGGLSALLLVNGLFKNDNDLVLDFVRIAQEIKRIFNGLQQGTLASDPAQARQARTVLSYYIDKLIEWLDKNQYAAPILEETQMQDIKAAAKDIAAALPGLAVETFLSGNMNTLPDVMQRLKKIADVVA